MEQECIAEALCGLHRQPTDSSATEDEDIEDILSFSAGEEGADDTDDTENGMMTEEDNDTGDELDRERATPRAAGSRGTGARYTAQKPGRFTGLNLEGPTGASRETQSLAPYLID